MASTWTTGRGEDPRAGIGDVKQPELPPGIDSPPELESPESSPAMPYNSMILTAGPVIATCATAVSAAVCPKTISGRPLGALVVYRASKGTGVQHPRVPSRETPQLAAQHWPPPISDRRR